MAGRGLGRSARRVVIKSRYVVLKRASAQSVATHLRYIARDGVTRGGERGQAYGADTDRADLKAFEERGSGDRHQFRFIVSVEDAPQMEDLRQFTRTFMQRMSADLQTPLDWVAVDHWDTDNPHTHIVLRGRTADDQDLVIAPNYVAHGMRTQAQEIATQWLGPRTEREIQESLQKEVLQDRFTSLDRQLLARAQGPHIDLAAGPSRPARDGQPSQLLGSRLQHLEALGFAEKVAPQRWVLDPSLREKLAELSARGDIIQTMHRALKGERRELALERAPQASLVGRILAKGLVDEVRDSGFAVLDGLDGRAHYVALPRGEDLAKFPIGGIAKLVALPGTADDAKENTARQRRTLVLLSEIPLERQVQYLGPTWLDRELIGNPHPASMLGFGKAAQAALQQRADFLVGEELASHGGNGTRFAPNLLGALGEREMRLEGEKLAKAMGRSFAMPRAGTVLRGTLVSQQRMQCGTFGLLDNGVTLSFVPWNRNLANRYGQHLSVDSGIEDGRRRGIFL